MDTNIKDPYVNNYCDKCIFYYLLDGDESRCKVITIGISDVMCAQVRECYKFKERKEK